MFLLCSHKTLLLMIDVNSNMFSSADIDHIEELKRQIRVLEMEKDATSEEVDDLRRRLQLSKKEIRRLRAVLIKSGEEMVKEGGSVVDIS